MAAFDSFVAFVKAEIVKRISTNDGPTSWILNKIIVATGVGLGTTAKAPTELGLLQYSLVAGGTITATVNTIHILPSDSSSSTLNLPTMVEGDTVGVLTTRTDSATSVNINSSGSTFYIEDSSNSATNSVLFSLTHGKVIYVTKNKDGNFIIHNKIAYKDAGIWHKGTASNTNALEDFEIRPIGVGATSVSLSIDNISTGAACAVIISTSSGAPRKCDLTLTHTAGTIAFYEQGSNITTTGSRTYYGLLFGQIYWIYKRSAAEVVVSQTVPSILNLSEKSSDFNAELGRQYITGAATTSITMTLPTMSASTSTSASYGCSLLVGATSGTNLCSVTLAASTTRSWVVNGNAAISAISVSLGALPRGTRVVVHPTAISLEMLVSIYYPGNMNLAVSGGTFTAIPGMTYVLNAGTSSWTATLDAVFGSEAAGSSFRIKVQRTAGLSSVTLSLSGANFYYTGSTSADGTSTLAITNLASGTEIIVTKNSAGNYIVGLMFSAWAHSSRASLIDAATGFRLIYSMSLSANKTHTIPDKDINFGDLPAIATTNGNSNTGIRTHIVGGQNTTVSGTDNVAIACNNVVLSQSNQTYNNMTHINPVTKISNGRFGHRSLGHCIETLLGMSEVSSSVARILTADNNNTPTSSNTPVAARFTKTVAGFNDTISSAATHIVDMKMFFGEDPGGSGVHEHAVIHRRYIVRVFRRSNGTYYTDSALLEAELQQGFGAGDYAMTASFAVVSDRLEITVTPTNFASYARATCKAHVQSFYAVSQW